MKQKKGGNDFPSIAYCQKSGGGRIYKKESEYVYAKTRCCLFFVRREEEKYGTEQAKSKDDNECDTMKHELLAPVCLLSLLVGRSVGCLVD